jgi:CheY-like chemotaxis protein
MALNSLLVCDDTRAVQVLSSVLAELDISVEECGDSDSAVARLSEGQFDALVMDCKNEGAAMQLATAARQTPDNQGTLIVALVDSGNKVRELFAKGVNFVLYKPISAERAEASLRAAQTLMRRERRRYPRIALHAPASMDYAGTENVPATILDLSEDGIAIQCERRLPPRCKIYFQFVLPNHASKVRLSGLSMWQDSSGRVGIRFIDVPQSSRRALGEWLRTNATAARDESDWEPAKHASEKTATSQRIQGDFPAADRRGRSRHTCRLSADVFVAGTTVPQHCHVSDISSGGCYIDTTSPLAVMTEVEIVVRTSSMKLRVGGVVRETHPACGMGISFTLRTPGERSQVQKFVETQAGEQSVLS